MNAGERWLFEYVKVTHTHKEQLFFSSKRARTSSHRFELLPAEAVEFTRGWMAWTDTHVAHLVNTVPLAGHDEVGLGLIDGTAAFAEPLACSLAAHDEPNEEPLGFVWLFNPTYDTRTATLVLDDRLSRFDDCLYAANATAAEKPDSFLELVEVYRCGSPATASVQRHSRLGTIPTRNLTLVETSLEARTIDEGSNAYAASVAFQSTSRSLPKSERTCRYCRWGQATAGDLLATASYGSSLALALDGSSCLMLSVSFARSPTTTMTSRKKLWRHAQKVPLTPTTTRAAAAGNSSFVGSATVPLALFDQLDARKASYPVQWTAVDADASWLNPSRLLLFLQLNCRPLRRATLLYFLERESGVESQRWTDEY